MNRVCTRCKTEKPIELFKKTSQRPCGRSSWCKSCHSHNACKNQAINRERATANGRKHKLTDKWAVSNKRYKAGRRRVHRLARPAWFDRSAVDKIYSDAARSGLHVDHIVPLKNPLVCGLHVQDNLLPIDPDINRIKGNRYWPDMPAHFEIPS